MSSKLRKYEDNLFDIVKFIPTWNLYYGLVRFAYNLVIGKKAEAAKSFAQSIIAPTLGPYIADLAEEYILNSRKLSLEWKALKDIQKQLQPGDLIEISRDSVSHYALFIGGENEILTFIPKDTNSKTVSVAWMPLEKVCGDSKIRIRNHDRMARKKLGVSPRSKEEIIKAVQERIGTELPYDLNSTNSEFYSTYFLYGAGFRTPKIPNLSLKSLFKLLISLAFSLPSFAARSLWGKLNNRFRFNKYKKQGRFNKYKKLTQTLEQKLCAGRDDSS